MERTDITLNDIEHEEKIIGEGHALDQALSKIKPTIFRCVTLLTVFSDVIVQQGKPTDEVIQGKRQYD